MVGLTNFTYKLYPNHTTFRNDRYQVMILVQSSKSGKRPLEAT
jgi:hypothetical protein